MGNERIAETCGEQTPVLEDEQTAVENEKAREEKQEAEEDE